MALSTDVTRPRRPRASSKARRTIREISRSWYGIVSSADRSPAAPDGSSREPKYTPPVSSRTMIMSTPVEQLGSDRGGRHEGRVDRDRAQVRVQAEAAAQGEQGLLGANGRAGVGPFRPAHGAEQDGVRRVARLDVLGSDRDPVRVDRDAAGEDLRPDGVEPEPPPGRLDDPPRGLDDLGADPVARDRGDPVGLKVRPPSWQALAGLLVRERHGDAVDLGAMELVGRDEIGVERRLDDVRG